MPDDQKPGNYPNLDDLTSMIESGVAADESAAASPPAKTRMHSAPNLDDLAFLVESAEAIPEIAALHTPESAAYLPSASTPAIDPASAAIDPGNAAAPGGTDEASAKYLENAIDLASTAVDPGSAAAPGGTDEAPLEVSIPSSGSSAFRFSTASDSPVVAEPLVTPTDDSQASGPTPIPVVLTEVVPADVPPATPAVSAPGTIRHGEARGGIEILVEMAAKGEIDPADIDIIEVTDLFLRAIAAAPKENLRQSGKILFHASVLLRMKAEAWLDLQDAPMGDDFLEFDADGSPIIYDSQREPIARQITIQDLERALVRRSHMHNIRTRRVTLEQLIEALREAERLERFRLQRKSEPRIDLSGQHEVNDVEDILELAHEEDIETVIAKVEQILAETLDPKELTPFIKLIRLLDKKGDWVDAFLAVLFLSNSGKLTLQQEEFYGPLFIARPEAQPAAAVLQPS